MNPLDLGRFEAIELTIQIGAQPELLAVFQILSVPTWALFPCSFQPRLGGVGRGAARCPKGRTCPVRGRAWTGRRGTDCKGRVGI